MSSASSEQERSSEPSPSIEELERLRRRVRSLFMRLSAAAMLMSREDQDSSDERFSAGSIMIFNPATNSMMVIQGGGDLGAMFSELSNKNGPRPASKASIDAMPMVKITEEGGECAICLTEFEVGGDAKEMPCKHKYHSDCIRQWLGTNGSCPVCRYKLPVEVEENIVENGANNEDSGRTRADGRITVLFIGRGDLRDSDSASTGDSPGDNSTDSDGTAAMDGTSTTQDME